MRRLREALDPEALLDEPDTLRLSPLMTEWDDTAQAQPAEPLAAAADEFRVPRTGAWWAEGFLDAVADFGADWPDPDARDALAPAYEGLLLAVGVLAHDTEGEPSQATCASTGPKVRPRATN